jgi:hypothetical protein
MKYTKHYTSFIWNNTRSIHKNYIFSLWSIIHSLYDLTSCLKDTTGHIVNSQKLVQAILLDGNKILAPYFIIYNCKIITHYLFGVKFLNKKQKMRRKEKNHTPCQFLYFVQLVTWHKYKVQCFVNIILRGAPH